MLVDFHMDKLKKLLFDFYEITGISISVWDAQLNQLDLQPKSAPTYCSCIKQSLAGATACFESDKKLLNRVRLTKTPQTHICHAGLSDTGIAIDYNGQILGFFIFGQIRPEYEMTVEEIIKIANSYNIEKDSLVSAYGKLKVYTPTFIQAASDILTMATRFLWLSNHIKIKADDIAAKIDEYIDKNIQNSISVDELCGEFNLSKNMLYSISHKAFGTTVSNYILGKRIMYAKNLLMNSTSKISEIASNVGIKDYNYFTKVFKKETGMLPSEYRRSVLPFGVQSHPANKQSLPK